ncbi:MMPL family transporter, partial [Candidatus Bipolaricaulota bacterium]|nr:MMPL family transporter [Candidatus Bipolaricaulota bacterium]
MDSQVSEKDSEGQAERFHFIERYREEMAGELSQQEALVRAAETTGTGIVYNALALALGFGIMMLSAFQGLQNFGLLIAMTMVVS